MADFGIHDWLRLFVILQSAAVSILYIKTLPQEWKDARASDGDAHYVYIGRVWMQVGVISSCWAIIVALVQLIAVNAPFAGTVVAAQLTVISFVLAWAFVIQRRELQSPEGKAYAHQK